MTSTDSSSAPVLPARRLSFAKHAPQVYRAIAAFERSIELDHRLFEMVKLRASIINGCSYCVDMHTTDLLEAGEDPRWVASIAAWHHAAFYTERERAALAFTDAVTRLGDEGVPDDVWDEAVAQFPDDELAQLLSAVLAINVWNRLAVTLHTLPDDIAKANR